MDANFFPTYHTPDWEACDPTYERTRKALLDVLSRLPDAVLSTVKVEWLGTNGVSHYLEYNPESSTHESWDNFNLLQISEGGS